MITTIKPAQSALAFTALCFAAASLPAQWTYTAGSSGGVLGPSPVTQITRSGSKTMSMGNRYLGGSLTVSGRFWANRYSTGNDVGGWVNVDAYGKLLRSTGKLVDLNTSMSSSAFGSLIRGNAYFTLVVAGNTLLNSSHSFATGIRRFRPSSRSYNLFNPTPSYGVDVGIGTVTVRGNVGGNASVALDAVLSTGGYAQLSGTASVAATATGAASFKILPWLGTGLGAGLELDGEIMKNTLTPVVTADARPSTGSSVRVTGGVGYTLDAIRLKLKACGYYVLGSGCKTLTSWSSPRISLPDLLQL